MKAVSGGHTDRSEREVALEAVDRLAAAPRRIPQTPGACLVAVCCTDEATTTWAKKAEVAAGRRRHDGPQDRARGPPSLVLPDGPLSRGLICRRNHGQNGRVSLGNGSRPRVRCARATAIGKAKSTYKPEMVTTICAMIGGGMALGQVADRRGMHALRGKVGGAGEVVIIPSA